MTDESRPSVDQLTQHGRRTVRPFATIDAAHVLVRVAEELEWDLTDPAAFLKRVQHVEFGLSAEVEFAAILRWLGRCSLVHRLSEDALVDPARCDSQIPDLFAVFESGGKSCTALIEVKTTEALELTFQREYLDRLRSYAVVAGQPLLIAWRPRPVGFWFLFDLDTLKLSADPCFTVDLGHASRNDLMGVLAGDFALVPTVGAGLYIEMKRVGEKSLTEDGYEAVFVIDQACFRNSNGVPVKDVPNSILWTILSASEYREEVTDEIIKLSYLSTGAGTRAQLVLRAVASFPLTENERIHWKSIGRNLDAIVASGTILAEAETQFGTFIRYILHHQPNTMPTFIPANWKQGD